MKHIIVEQDNELYESDEFFAYIKRGDSANMLGDVSMDDAYHIAIATINRIDVLVSWNFKHIVNWDKK